MDKLSFELVEHIASYLDLGDAMALSATCHLAQKACYSRADPERYLRSTFRHPRYLLAAMSDSGCIISGSRALEFFIPGSINPSPSASDPDSPDPLPSDWNFLIPVVQSSALRMMDALEKCGVVWEDPLADVFALVDKPAGSVATVSSKAIYFAQGHVHNCSPREVELFYQLRDFVLQEVLRGPRVRVEVLPEPGVTSRYKMTEMPPTAEDAAEARRRSTRPAWFELFYNDAGLTYPVCTISGYIWAKNGRGGRQKGQKQEVRLFQCLAPGDDPSTPLQYVIRSYYATHVQCFISGWSAGHFFYDLTRQRLALSWKRPDDMSHSESVQECIRKYRSRGYRFFDRMQPYVKFEDHLQRLWPTDSESEPEPVEAAVELDNIVRAFSSACDSHARGSFINDRFKFAIGPAMADITAATDETQRRAAEAAALAAAAAASCSLSAAYNVHIRDTRDTTTTRETLSPDTQKAIHAAAYPLSGGHLGIKGSLFVRFQRLHDEIWSLSAPNNRHHHHSRHSHYEEEASRFEFAAGTPSDSPHFHDVVPCPFACSDRMPCYTAALTESIKHFRFTVPINDHPTAFEHELPKASWPCCSSCASPGAGAGADADSPPYTASKPTLPSLCDTLIRATAAGKIKGDRAAPQAAVLQSSGDDASEGAVNRRQDMLRYHRLLLSFKKKTFMEYLSFRDYDHYAGRFLPPQI